MNLISACLQISAAGAGITDLYGGGAEVVIPLGTAVRLDLDLRGDADPATGVLMPCRSEEFTADAAAHYFAIDQDFDQRSEPLLLCHSGITVSAADNGGTIFSVAIPNTGTGALAAALGGTQVAGFYAEIGAIDRNGVTIYSYHFPISVRNRIYLGGEGSENIVGDPAYYTAAEMKALMVGLAADGIGVEIFDASDSSWREYDASVPCSADNTRIRVWMRGGGSNVVKSEIPLVRGVDGVSPAIGENGNWWIGGTDTGVAARTDRVIAAAGLVTAGEVASLMDTADFAASQVHITDEGNCFSASTVEGALQEIGSALAGVETALQEI